VHQGGFYSLDYIERHGQQNIEWKFRGIPNVLKNYGPLLENDLNSATVI